ncbi:hypothetical protein CR513_55046, partial [Mucuna pruriens]
MVRSIISHSSLLESLWEEGLKIIVYILNRVPTKAINKTCYELLTGKNPTVAWLYRPHERKLDSRIFYDPIPRSFFEMGNARILEEVEFEKEENIRNVVFKEKIVNDIDYDEVLPQTLIKQPQQPQEVSLRISIKEKRHAIPNYCIVFLQEHEDDIGLTENDPINFCQAMQSSNSQKWVYP